MIGELWAKNRDDAWSFLEHVRRDDGAAPAETPGGQVRLQWLPLGLEHVGWQSWESFEVLSVHVSREKGFVEIQMPFDWGL